MFFWKVYESWKIRRARQFHGCSNVANMTVHTVLARVTGQVAGFAEAGIVYQIPNHSLRKLSTVDENQR
jgi:hypothetical protein